MELRRSPIVVAKQHGSAVKERVRRGAAHLGWQTSAGKRPHVGGVDVPNPKILRLPGFARAEQQAGGRSVGR